MGDPISKRAAQRQTTLQAKRRELAGDLREAKVINEAELRAFVDAVDVGAQLERARHIVKIARTAVPTAGQAEYEFFKSLPADTWRPAGGWREAMDVEQKGWDLVAVLKEESAFRRFDEAARRAGESGLIPQELAQSLRQGVIRSRPALELAGLRDTAHKAGRGDEYDALVRTALDYCAVQHLKASEMIADGIVPGAFEARRVAALLLVLGKGWGRHLFQEEEFKDATLNAWDASPTLTREGGARHAGHEALREALREAPRDASAAQSPPKVVTP